MHRDVIRQRLDREMPFMATEHILVRAVKGGADRQEAHEIIRRHSMDAAKALKGGGARNDLLDRLAKEKALGLSKRDIEGETDPAKFTGRASRQVDEFLKEVVRPLLAGSAQGQAEEIRV